MHEEILAAVLGGDEAVSLCIVEPLDGSGCHVASSCHFNEQVVEGLETATGTRPGLRGQGSRGGASLTSVAVRVRLFAGLRERAGWSERELDGAATVGDVWPALGLGEEPAGLLYAVNKEYAEPDQRLADGDEVAVIPPVSGGAFRLSSEPLSLDAAVDEVRSERAGAIATFVGTTRVESRGRTVEYLDYEAYAGMAENVMAEIAAALERR